MRAVVVWRRLKQAGDGAEIPISPRGAWRWGVNPRGPRSIRGWVELGSLIFLPSVRFVRDARGGPLRPLGGFLLAIPCRVRIFRSAPGLPL